MDFDVFFHISLDYQFSAFFTKVFTKCSPRLLTSFVYYLTPTLQVRVLVCISLVVVRVVVRAEVVAEDLEGVRSEAVNPVEGVVVVELDLVGVAASSRVSTSRG